MGIYGQAGMCGQVFMADPSPWSLQYINNIEWFRCQMAKSWTDERKYR
jgi:hypothetical protein